MAKPGAPLTRSRPDKDMASEPVAAYEPPMDLGDIACNIPPHGTKPATPANAGPIPQHEQQEYDH